MRNLHVLARQEAVLPELGCNRDWLTAVDWEAKHIYAVAETQRDMLLVCHLEQQHELQRVRLTDAEQPGAKPMRASAIAFVPDESCVCIGCDTGDILTVDVSKAAAQVLVVGALPAAVTAIAWSPDSELGVITCADGTCSILTQDWDQIASFPLAAPVVRTSAVAKLELFRVRDRLQAPPVQEKPADVQNVAISWRGDGRFFAVSSVDAETDGVRRIRVWDRHGSLCSTSEAVDVFAGASLAWRPSGELIGAPLRDPRLGLLLALFEQNGLRHGEVTLAAPGADAAASVHHASWSYGSEVLAVVLQNTADSFLLQMWTRSNYHWFCKLSERIPVAATVVWHPEHVMQCCVVREDGVCSHVTLCQRYDVAGPRSIAVNVDADRLLCTAFAERVVPPPMSAYQLTLPDAVADVAIASNGAVAATLANLSIAVFPAPTPVTAAAAAGAGADAASASCSVLPHKLSSQPRHLCWLSPSQLLAVATADATAQDQLLVLRTDRREGAAGVQVVPMSGERAVAIAADARCTGIAAVQTASGRVLCLDARCDAEASPTLDTWRGRDNSPLVLPQLCEQMLLVRSDPALAIPDLVIALSSRARLFINGHLLASDVTSIAVHDEYLLSATMAQVIVLDALRELVSGPVKQRAAAQAAQQRQVGRPYDVSLRNVELGARLVFAIPSDHRVLLQMPRGNLEMVYPRALVLHRIRTLLSQDRYGTALRLGRKHRIDLNYLCDWSADQFASSGVALLVEQTRSSDDLNLFLSALRDGDTTVSMYPAFSQAVAVTDVRAAAAMPGKVNRVCTAVRAAIDAAPPDVAERLELSRLTTYVRMQPPQLEQLLHQVQAKAKAEGTAALRYLMVMVDADQLYNTALGMYDFPLTLHVAQLSQKDPKEYLPFLSRVRAMPELLQRHAIDVSLKRYASALRHLIQVGPEKEEEALSLALQHGLYASGEPVLREHAPHLLPRLWRAYADALLGDKRYAEAAAVYERAEAYPEAARAWQQSGAWREMHAALLRAGVTEEGIAAMLRDTASEFSNMNRFSDAADVFETLQDYPAACDAACRAEDWPRAYLLALRGNCMPGVEAAVQDAVTSGVAHLETVAGAYDKAYDRLEAIVKARPAPGTAEAAAADAESARDRDDDLFSVGTDATGYTRFSAALSTTASTTATARTSLASLSSAAATRVSALPARVQRKQAAKAARKKRKGRVRPGSPAEEQYVVESIRRLALTPAQQHGYISLLVIAARLTNCPVAAAAAELGQRLAEVQAQMQRRAPPQAWDVYALRRSALERMLLDAGTPELMLQQPLHPSMLEAFTKVDLFVPSLMPKDM